MTTRTFRQMGIAFGSQTANITAKINDTIVYQGPVTTLNENFPVLPAAEYTVTNVLFSWTADMTFSGPQTVEIVVDNNAALLLAQITANYTEVIGLKGKMTSGPDGYIPFQYTQFGNTYTNGVLRDVTHGDLPGMWWWQLAPGTDFVENITITPGTDFMPA